MKLSVLIADIEPKSDSPLASVITKISGGLLCQRAKVHHLVDHCRKALARYSPMKSALRARFAPDLLHHRWGRDLHYD